MRFPRNKIFSFLLMIIAANAQAASSSASTFWRRTTTRRSRESASALSQTKLGDSRGVRTRVLLKINTDLIKLYTPEHGLDGIEKAGRYVPTRRDRVTGLVAYSLYGPTRKPTAAMLNGIDVLVFDLQDIGCRSYTYISTMGKCMEAAAENNIPFVVLDRPNPLGSTRVEGPLVEPRWVSFVSQFPVLYVHGMTCGELARMINAKGWINGRCELRVIPGCAGQPDRDKCLRAGGDESGITHEPGHAQQRG